MNTVSWDDEVNESSAKFGYDKDCAEFGEDEGEAEFREDMGDTSS
jgi:hypothetical protein